jgi:hypothetical protein
LFVVDALCFELLGGVLDRFDEMCAVFGSQPDLDDDHAVVVVPVQCTSLVAYVGLFEFKVGFGTAIAAHHGFDVCRE